LREGGIEPDVVAGHSLGEYAAAYAAGALGLEDGVRLVAERARLMGEAARQNPGGMVALIGADPAEVARATEEAEGTVVAANFNTPRQTVISGEKSALEAVGERVRGGRSSWASRARFIRRSCGKPRGRWTRALRGSSGGAGYPDGRGFGRGCADERGGDQAGVARRWVAVVERFLDLRREGDHRGGGGRGR
jgi:hypothetical protein